jgi:hypothetical protein
MSFRVKYAYHRRFHLTISGKSNQGEGSVGRGFAGPNRGETSWRQTLLVPAEMITVRLDLGWHGPERIGMFAAEASVSGTRELLALEVHPAHRYDSLDHWLGSAQRWQASVVRDLFDPDPF